MPTYIGRSEWRATRDGGRGRVSVGSHAFTAAVAAKTRPDEMTNPQEMVGAALAGCFALELSRTLANAGHPASAIRVSAAVELRHDGRAARIPRISLDVQVEADRFDEPTLRRLSEEADRACPVARALGGAEIDIATRFAGRP